MVTKVAAVSIYAGDDIVFPTYTFLSGEDPLDLSTWTDWAAQWRPTLTSDTVLDLDVDTSELATGIVTVSVDAETTRTMGQSGVWDLQATLSGDVRTWLRGRTIWMNDVTR